MSKAGKFRKITNVIVRPIAQSFVKAIGTEGKDVNIELARKQHKAYITALKEAGAKVYHLPTQDERPDSVFVEDVAVIVENKALITRPGVRSRILEVTGELEQVLQKKFAIKTNVVQDEQAYIDGGDVIFTGKEILAGRSKRTNDKGIDALRRTFDGYPVVAVDVLGPLHLTTVMGLFAEDTLCVSNASQHGQTMFEQINRNSNIKYSKVEVPDDAAANCIAINDTLICKSERENPESYKVLCANAGGRRVIGLEMSEIEKAVGSLTCMSLRFCSNKLVDQCCKLA